jgi:hypothetical protein
MPIMARTSFWSSITRTRVIGCFADCLPDILKRKQKAGLKSSGVIQLVSKVAVAPRGLSSMSRIGTSRPGTRRKTLVFISSVGTDAGPRIVNSFWPIREFSNM